MENKTNNSVTVKYFIEDLRNGKWVKFPQCFEDIMIDTSRSAPEEEERKWTNDPNQAAKWDTFEEAEAHNKRFWNMIDIEVTEHEFVGKDYPQENANPNPVAVEERLYSFNNLMQIAGFAYALQDISERMVEEKCKEYAANLEIPIKEHLPVDFKEILAGWINSIDSQEYGMNQQIWAKDEMQKYLDKISQPTLLDEQEEILDEVVGISIKAFLLNTLGQTEDFRNEMKKLKQFSIKKL